MRQVKISGSISGTIATGPYQNLKPGFAWEEVIDDCSMTDEEIEERITMLYEKCGEQLRRAEQVAIVERIARERADFRFKRSPATGKMLPSVTSVINFDTDFFVSPEDLQQYASQGNITHARVKEYIASGEWKDPKDINEVWADLVILKKGSLQLDPDSGDFPGFLKKHPISEMVNGERGFNDEYEYTGEPDFTGTPGWEGIDAVPTVFDVKRTAVKVKNGMQLAAYSKLVGAKQGVIIPLNDKTKANFSKPVVYTEADLAGYWEMFCRKREDFRKRYGA